MPTSVDSECPTHKLPAWTHTPPARVVSCPPWTELGTCHTSRGTSRLWRPEATVQAPEPLVHPALPWSSCHSLKALASGSCSWLHPNATFNPEGLSLTQPQAGEVRIPRWLKEPVPQRADPIPTRKDWRSWATGSELGEGRTKDERAGEEASSQDLLIPAYPPLFPEPHPYT